jgi:outer membrane protein
MNNSAKNALTLLALGAALCVSSSASAQSAKQWAISLGAKRITPIVDSGFLTAPTQPGVKTDATADTEPVVTFTYMITDHVSAETYIAPPYKVKQTGAGTLQGTGVVGSVESLPATFVIQYRFLEPTAKFRPYLGAGVSYAYFQKERGSAQLTALSNTGGPPTTFKVGNAWGSTFQAGFTFTLTEKWFADVSFTKSYVKNTTRFSTGQTIEAKLDPVSSSFAIGYRF